MGLELVQVTINIFYEQMKCTSLTIHVHVNTLTESFLSHYQTRNPVIGGERFDMCCLSVEWGVCSLSDNQHNKLKFKR